MDSSDLVGALIVLLLASGAPLQSTDLHSDFPVVHNSLTDSHRLPHTWPQFTVDRPISRTVKVGYYYCLIASLSVAKASGLTIEELAAEDAVRLGLVGVKV